MKTRIVITDNKGKDISDEVELKNGRGTQFFSEQEIHYKGKRIGFIGSAGCDITDKRFN